MKESQKRENSKPAVNHLLRGLLLPAALTYGAGALARVLAYAGGVMPRYQAPVPVISIGNLTVGGTGKTPVAIDLANRFVSVGYRPVVLSRGYKRKSVEPYVVVSDGKTILASCEDAGDEPYLIALSTPGTGVIVGARRAETAQIAIYELGCNLIILDDGFQHLKIKRDVDIVLIDYNDDINNDLLVPAGRLREPLAALARASSVVITKVPNEPDHQKLERTSQIIHKYNPIASIGLLRFNANALVTFDTHDPSGSRLASRADLTDAPRCPLAFCGLARPERFFQELKLNNIVPAQTLAFPDHHWYVPADGSKLNDLARKNNADAFITTEKDIVKFANLRYQMELRLFALGLTTQWISALPPAMEEMLASGPESNQLNDKSPDSKSLDLKSPDSKSLDSKAGQIC
jgi:tetraacyldisaccharide 4'-kinase